MTKKKNISRPLIQLSTFVARPDKDLLAFLQLSERLARENARGK